MASCSNNYVKMASKGTGLEVCGLERGPILGFCEQDNGLPVGTKCGTFRE
jgi:hypothetical protein